jgi:Tol biopolymer transport system component
MMTPLDKKPLSRFGYYLDESDSVIVVLRCEDGSVVTVVIRSGLPLRPGRIQVRPPHLSNDQGEATMTRRTTLVLTVGLAVVLFWLSSGCTDAGQQHRAISSGDDQRAEISRGKIAFMRQSDIYMINSDGTRQTNLTKTQTGVGGGAWSPSGKKLAFFARPAGERSLDIYVINADGTGATNLTRTKASTEGAPSWSPDSKKITYLRGSDPSSEIYTDIYVMDSDGTSKTRLIKARDTKAFEVGFESPVWSPDGEKIAFMRTTRVDFANSASSSAAPATGPSDLYVMKADGTGLNKLSEEISYTQSPLWSPLWSPDGKEIAFSGAGENGERKYVVNADGTEPRELLPNVQAHISSYSWSPNGEKIAFAAVHYRGELDIYVIDADGTVQTNLTRTKTIIEGEPSWSPDGKQIAFTRGDVGDVYVDQDVYVMNADGTGRTRLANDASSPTFTPRDRE